MYLRENHLSRHNNPFPEILDDTVYIRILKDPNYWISQDLEDKIIQIIAQSLDISGILYHLGTESLITNAYDLLPLDDSRIDLEEMIQRLPILIGRLTRAVYLNVKPVADHKVLFIFKYLPEYQEKWYDAVFFQGMLNGLAVLFELKTFTIRMTKTRLFGIHVSHKELGEDILFGADSNEYELEWLEDKMFLSRSRLTKDDVSNRHRVMVTSRSDSHLEEISIVDVKDVVRRSRELAIENRDLEAAVEVLKSFKQELEKKQLSMAKDLRLAKNIQKGLIPEIIPDWNGIQFWTGFTPMQEVSGDYYDYFPYNMDKLGVAVCDVSGHGVPAAFITALSKLLFSNYKKPKPSEIFKLINRELLDLVKQQGYTTCVYVLIHDDYKVLYSIAGHPRPILFRAKTNKAEICEGDGTFLGMFPDAGETFLDFQIQLEPGDKMFLYTDGLTEAENDKGDAFGETKLIQIIESCFDKSIQETVENILSIHKEFTMGTDPMDDITLLGLQLSPRLPEFKTIKSKGDAAYQNKQFSEAVTFYEKAHQILPRDLDTQLLYGKALAYSRNFDKAIELLESYNKFKTNHFKSHSVLGYCYYQIELFEKAELEWKKAHSISDANLSNLCNLAQVYAKLNEKKKMKDVIQKMKSIEKSYLHILPLEKKWESLPDE
ncbi:serine/threonine protein phosphatase [Leptospira kanakyensis]|uniref:Serine/threonine protein phosphatase n=1 Tax=Leptospira kanakyensis TaxID=2484968 RepID=A0A6N4QFV0_9LEPT|nr:SpoIIE family protein phosphatase [Leptospira kanakyensis]TGK50860.1 serine/threonine protein phosphatase [Leptospira kanakyensis]TGK63746.1 serine/threonine protein phosphatase [Leptospira kanakyensis]TGK69997.1 serine/threonine protein phosphatase [Leptospira kanakyensis]